MDIVKRIIELQEGNFITVMDISNKTGIPKSRIYGWINQGTRPKYEDSILVNEYIEKKLNNIPQPDATSSHINPTSKKKDYFLPLIPIEAVAGNGGGFDYQITDVDIIDRYNVPEFSSAKADCLIKIKGSSMSPKYNSGDILACKRIETIDFIQWNRPYVLDTTQGALVKRINKGISEDSWTLVSDNEKYPPFNIPIESVRKILIVVGVIRLE